MSQEPTPTTVSAATESAQTPLSDACSAAIEQALATLRRLPRPTAWQKPQGKGRKQGAAEELPLRAFAADAHAWQLQRFNSQPGELRLDPQPSTVTATSLGLASQDMSRPRFWAFARSPNAKNDPRHPDFSRLRPESVVCSSTTRLDAMLDAAGAGLANVKAAGYPAALQGAEESAWAKITPQRGTTAFWYVQAQGPGAGAPLPPDFIECLRHVVSVLIGTGLQAQLEPTSDPTDTNSGYPFFQPGLAGKLFGSLLARRGSSASAMLREAEWAAPALGLPTASALAFGLSGRSGPISKATPLLRYRGSGQWERVGEWRGFAQRNRVVQMGSAPVNFGIGPIYDVWVAGAKHTPGQWFGGGRPTPGQVPTPPGWHEYDSDLTGLDLSVSSRLQDALADALHRAVPRHRTELHDAIDVHRLTGSLALITPSWDLNDSTCSIVNARSGVHSGQKATGREDTVYNVAANLYALKQQGFAIHEWPRAPDFRLYTLGDDTRLDTARELDAERFVAAYEELGLKVKLARNVTFLSKYEGHVGDAVWSGVPIAGRVVQQTLFNEHEATGKWGRLVAPVGLIARCQGIDRWPAQLAADVWEAVRLAEWIEDLGLHTATGLAECVRTLQEGPFQQQLIDAVKQATTGEASWIGAELRGGEHSPLGSFLRSLLGTELAKMEAAPVALRDWQANGMRKLGPARARHYYLSAWHALSRGRGPFGRLALEMLQEAPGSSVAHTRVLAEQLLLEGGLTTTTNQEES